METSNNITLTSKAGTEIALTSKQQSPCLDTLLKCDINNPENQRAQIAFVNAQLSVTVENAMQTPQLSRLRKESAGDLAEAITRMLVFVNNRFNLDDKKKLSSAQITMLTVEIMKVYWNLKFDEVVYVLREGSRGTWGKIYNRIDTEIVHNWFVEYLQDRNRMIESRSFEQHQQQKADIADMFGANLQPLDNEQLEAFYAKAAQAKTEEEKKPAEKPVNPALTALIKSCKTLPLPELENLLKTAIQYQSGAMVKILEAEIEGRKKGATA